MKDRTLIEMARTMLDEYKKPKTSKFAPKVDEGFLLGYGSNVHAYCVFNKTNGCVEIARDVTFDESNNSQKEQVVHENVDDDEAPCEAIRRMAIGDVRSQESRNEHNQPPHQIKNKIKNKVVIMSKTQVRINQAMIRG